MTPANYNEIDSIYMMPDELQCVHDVIARMPQDGLFVEWGSGGSTCRWLELLSDKQKLISIEDDLAWFEKVSRVTRAHFGPLPLSKFELIYAPEKYNINRKKGELSEEMPFGTEHYINPKAEIFDASVYFIDGIARSACMAAILLKHTKKNPTILWHDYTGRSDAYGWIIQFCDVEILSGTLARIHI